MKTIKEEWERFVTEIGLDNAPADQIKEMRRAFYAGCWLMLQGTADIASEMPEEDAEAKLQFLEDELKDFNRDVMTGKA